MSATINSGTDVTGNPAVRSATGRPRDADIDTAVIAVAQQHLARFGYEGMSVASVASEAGTTRQALYRRWATKADLATAAIAHLAQAAEHPDSADPYADLVAELTTFHRGVTRPNGISLVGSMLQEATDPELRDLFLRRLVLPRRRRLRQILRRGVEAGLLDAEADVDLAVAACTGTLYALLLTGQAIPRTWPRRTATLVWRAMGGTVESRPK